MANNAGNKIDVLGSVNAMLNNGRLRGLYLVDAINVTFVRGGGDNWGGMVSPPTGPPYNLFMTKNMSAVAWAGLFAHEAYHAANGGNEVKAYERQFLVLIQLYKNAEDLEIRNEAAHIMRSFPMYYHGNTVRGNPIFYFDEEICFRFVNQKYPPVYSAIPTPNGIRFFINEKGQIVFIF